MRIPSLILLALPCATIACQSGDVPGGRARAVELKPEPPSPAAAAVVPKPAPKPASKKVGEPEGVRFTEAIDWQDWESGLRLAKAQKKPMMVVVYADWCPKCRALAPVFESKEVTELASKMVVVRQNHDDDPAWLQPFNQKYGGYVPRIFFFDSDGHVREDVNSGHPRYPYFYAAQQPDSLTRSMRQAIGS